MDVIGRRLADAGVPTLRLDYRQPAKTDPCVRDILAAMAELNKRYGASRFGLVGWSFGSAPVFTLATRLCHSPNQSQLQIGAVAVVAPQTADAFGIRDCPPMPVLLVHGSNDRCLSPMCSLSLKKAYDAAARTEKDRDQCEVLLLDGDDHCLSKHYEMAETRILNFLLDALAGPDHQRPPSSLHSLVPLARDGLKLMREGHDLEQAPSTGERESVNEPTRRRESESGI